MTRQSLNIHKKKDQFEDVSFVKDMTQHQLKVFIKRMWCNMQDLATAMDGTRPDISAIIDQILEGNRWTEKTLLERFQFFIHNGDLIEYDSSKNTFRVYNIAKNTISEPIKGQNYKEAQKTLNKIWKKKA